VTVVVLTLVPQGLRGHLTKWLLEISPGVFVGFVTSKVREHLWARIIEMSKDGRAIMVFAARNEQRLSFKVHKHQWEPVDYDGVKLMLRPSNEAEQQPKPKSGWSAASRRRRYGS
jgi:CRISPR-associated protein Cas2